jgi:hypothetical protein
MSKYLIVIYRKELSDNLLVQIAGLFSDASIEKINERMSLFIGAGFEGKYNSQKNYHCYRIMSDQIVPSLFFFEPRPLYVGTFNDAEENKCAMMSAHCFGVSTLIKNNIEKGLHMEPYFNAIFGQNSSLNMIAIEDCIKELKKTLRFAKNIQKKYYQDRIVTCVPAGNEAVSLCS